MKRVLATLLVLVFLVSGTGAFADAPDLKSMSDSQLLSLYDALRDEMAARGLVPSIALKSGKYIVGQDIQPGSYRLTCTGTEGESLGDAYSSLGSAYSTLLGDEWGGLMDSLGGAMSSLSEAAVRVLGDYGTVIREYSLKTGDSVRLQLQEGTALEISEGSVLLESE